MNNSQFCNSFKFILHRYSHYHHTDNKDGLPFHYLARLKCGTAKFVSRYRSATFQTGDVFYIPRGLSYQSYWYGGKDNVVEFDSIGFGTFPDLSGKNYLLQKVHFDQNQHNMLDIIALDYSVNCKNVGILYQLLSKLIDTMSFEPIAKDEQVLQAAREFMHNNTAYTIADVAKHCNISESSLYATFKRACGHTPIDEKHMILVEKATELLQTTDLSVGNIMEETGISSAPYFRKIFREVTGKTPIDVRKEKKYAL